MNCATMNAFMEVYDILNVRGAMNCATTNKEARELRDYEQRGAACKRRYELRDYEQESV